ncbi:MAG: thioesterase family protein [Deltaproteobacteria bacterium]|nr:thioesterase family protein [Deltaproteobacteria bacterium]
MTDDALERVLESLDLEVLDRDLLLGDPGPGEGRLFGGLVAAQSVVAAGRTVEAGDLHSLHAYFLRPGRYGSPIRFVVDRIRDGRTFTTRRVVAHQDGEAIFNLSASFARPDAGVAHQAEAAPEAPGPEGMIEWAELRARWWGHAIPKAAINEAIEVRVSEEVAPPSAPGMPPQRFVWLRPRGTPPDDPLLHSALLVFASDRTLTNATFLAAGITPSPAYQFASLDHAVWLHAAPRFDDWVLYLSRSPVAHAGRGLNHGAMFDKDGRRIASVTQEVLVRKIDPDIDADIDADIDTDKGSR